MTARALRMPMSPDGVTAEFHRYSAHGVRARGVTKSSDELTCGRRPPLLMQIVHDRLARSNFPARRAAARLGRMSRSTNRRHCSMLDKSEPELVLTASLTLRFATTRLAVRLYWPETGALDADAGLVLLLTDADAVPGGQSADPLIRWLGSAASAVVLAVPSPRTVRSGGRAHHDLSVDVLGWAAEHAAELGAHPQRLLVAGQHAAGARAAWLAIDARNNGWPQLRRQLLVYPAFSATCPMPTLLAGVSLATVMSAAPNDDASDYADRLRASGVEAHEIRAPTGSDPASLPAQPFEAMTFRETGGPVVKRSDDHVGGGKRT